MHYYLQLIISQASMSTIESLNTTLSTPNEIELKSTII